MNQLQPVDLGYARVSSAEQVLGTSLDDQVRKITKYANYEESILEHVFVDRGESGRKASRPDFDAMMNRCRQGGVRAIIVSKLDRFGRSVRHLAEAWEELEKLGVEFISLAENIDTSTTTGKFLRNMLAVIAELESDTIRDRMYGGRIALAQAGLWPAGRAPYGYRLVSDGRRNGIEIDENEEKQLRIAFDGIVKEGMTTGAICRRLSALGFTQPEGGPWERTMLRERLTRPHYTGVFTWHMSAGDFDIALPPIFTQAEFDLLQTALAATARPDNPKAATFPLTGHLHGNCEVHGEVSWSGRKKQGVRFYRCRGKQEREITKGKNCSCKYIKADLIEEAVWGQVLQIISQPERLLDYAKENLVQRGEQMGIESNQLAEIEGRIKSLEKNLREDVLKLVKQGMDADIVQNLSDDLKSEIQALKTHRNSLVEWQAENTAQSDQMRRVWEIADALHAALQSNDVEQRQAIFDAMDLHVFMGEDHKCKKCGGSGREVVYGQKGGRPSCSQCGGRGVIPELRIEGWLNDLLAEGKEEDALPFEDAGATDLHSASAKASLRSSPRGCTVEVELAFAVKVQLRNDEPTPSKSLRASRPPRTHCKEGHLLEGNSFKDSLGRVYCSTCTPPAKRRPQRTLSASPKPTKAKRPQVPKTKCESHDTPYDRALGCRLCKNEAAERYRRKVGKKARPDLSVECGNGHEMTPENTYVSPAQRKGCVACRRAATDRHRMKQAG